MADIIRLAEKTVDHVTKLGASHCEVLVADATHIVAEIEKSSMKQASEINDVGVCIRAFKNGCSGFAYSTGHDFDVVKRIAKLALSQAGAGTPDPDFKDLPEPRKPTGVTGLFDTTLAGIEPDDVVEMAISLSDAASSDKRIASVNAGVGVGWGEVALANSNGVKGYQKMTAFDASVEVVARSGKTMYSATDGGSSRRLDGGLIGRIGGNAKDHALMGLKQTKVPTGDLPVILDPLSIGFILLGAVGGGANAESVQRNRSYLAGRLGQTIGSSLLTVVDDPTLPWCSGSHSFDGEGVPGKRNVLVKKGELKSFLFDSYTSAKESVENTGNSSRGGALWGFRRPPAISSSTLVVDRGDFGFDEMVRETGDGVYLRATFDHPNLATGELSAMMMESFLIIDGEIGPSLRQATMGINLIDMFSRIDMVGKHAVDAFGVRTPPIRISSARIAGSG